MYSLQGNNIILIYDAFSDMRNKISCMHDHDNYFILCKQIGWYKHLSCWKSSLITWLGGDIDHGFSYIHDDIYIHSFTYFECNGASLKNVLSCGFILLSSSTHISACSIIKFSYKFMVHKFKFVHNYIIFFSEHDRLYQLVYLPTACLLLGHRFSNTQYYYCSTQYDT